ncbi:MAG: DUF4293 domain-containing protein [Prevotella sp.]|nr:DUF4293 domain-containing protein [Prevotella sp.]MBQ9650861.1 DUF4293 domain-containing protein [Prevotella sp.]
MIQRKQTLYLLVAVILSVVALTQPIAELAPVTMGANHVVYNLWVLVSNGMGAETDYSVSPLFVILLVATSLELITIFLYKHRPVQSRCCLGIMCLLLIWYVAYAALMVMMSEEYNAKWHFSWASCLPAAALLLVFLARMGVNADEALVRRSERLRD